MIPTLMVQLMVMVRVAEILELEMVLALVVPRVIRMERHLMKDKKPEPEVVAVVAVAVAVVTTTVILEAVLKAVRSKFPGELGEKNAQVVAESYRAFVKEMS